MSCLRENLTISSYGEGLETGRVHRVPRQFLTRQEAFKRLKHRLALEHVTGLSQLAVAQDLAAKILCDNIHSLLSQAAHDAAQLPSERRINRTFAVTAMRPLLPLLLLGRATARELADALDLLARRTYVHRPAKTRPRPTRPKPHKFMAMKTG